MSDEPLEWTPVKVCLGDLTHWADNPVTLSKTQARKLIKSTGKLGRMQTLAIGPANGDGKHILYDGHQRVNVWGPAFGMGLEVWALQSNRLLNEEEQRAVPIMLRAAVGSIDWVKLTGGWDTAQLGEWGMDKDLLSRWNNDACNLREMMTAEGQEPQDAEPQIDRAEELLEKWQVKTGDLWRIGEHRLLCGDSTKREDVERVMQGERAQVCFTSPPYAEQRKEQYGGIDESKYWEWFASVQLCVKLAIKNSGNFVLNIKPHAKEHRRSLYVFDLVVSLVRKEKWLFVDEFCWLRTGIPQQVVHRFKNAFEPCYWFVLSDDYLWYPENVMHESDSVPIALGKGAGDTNAARRQGKGGGAIQGNKIESGMAYPSNVLDFKQNANALGHPAAFPIELPSFFVRAMSDRGEIIFDPFVGSGTTIVACQNLGRKCRAIEISPAYCAVTLERMATAFPDLVIERI